jgi:hypothetical protein
MGPLHGGMVIWSHRRGMVTAIDLICMGVDAVDGVVRL